MTILELLGIEPWLGRVFIFALFGAVLRAGFGLSKAYRDKGYIRPDWRRVALEMLNAMCFGTLAVILMMDTGMIKINGILGSGGWALLGGFFGADLLNRLAESFGVSKGFKMALERLPTDLSPSQRKALEYVSENGSVTLEEYSTLNKISGQKAGKELKQLVSKGILTPLDADGKKFVF